MTAAGPKKRAPSKRARKRPRAAKAPAVPTIDAEVERLIEVVRDTPFLSDDRPRAESIELLDAVIARCEDLRDELLTEQAKFGD